MKITILTAGSRGDVQPYIALGIGLRSMGHAVRIATHRDFKPLLDEYGLGFSPVEGNPREILAGDAGQKLLKSRANPMAMLRHTLAVAEPILAQVFNDYWQACQDAEIILFHLLTALPAASIAEKLDIPAYPMYLQHVHATRAYPSAAAAPLPVSIPVLEGLYNRSTYHLEDRVFWRLIRPIINRWREQALELPPYKTNPFPEWSARGHPFFYGFSRHVLPKPSDWGDNVHITGYWFLNRSEDWRPPPALVDFLQSGPPPIYVGFGSMVHHAPEEMAEIVLNALDATKQRGVLLTGWGGLRQSDLPDHVIKIESAPHDWLFPQMRAVVHHGGAGTTAAGLRAGAPSIIIPFFGDQPFWGWRVKQLGVGPSPIPRKKLTAKSLAKAIEVAVRDKAMRERAESLGRLIRAENGVERAVRLLTRRFAENRHHM
ncbi:MAG: glycosyltransferase family 1 protein [Chloroflexi bacterium]|nr:glycosyltransferase family 1 protein [Chloroflexota bacterium]